MKKLIIFFKIFLIASVFLTLKVQAHAEEIFKPKIDINDPIKIELNPNQYNKYINILYKAFMGGSDPEGKYSIIEKRFKKWDKRMKRIDRRIEKHRLEMKIKAMREWEKNKNKKEKIRARDITWISY